MTSPFTPFANLTAVFQVPTGLETVNHTGNPELQVEPLVCVAYVVKQTLSKQQRQTPIARGAELSEILLEGHWINPPKAPQNLAPEQAGEAYMWRLEPGFTLPQSGFVGLAVYEAFVEANRNRITAEGRFVIAASIPDQFGVAGVLGDPFAGYLITNTVWADAL
ncbi:MAG: hypothetical protein AAGA46_17185 [Cyanobacteria bacterium P01_F01_bin.13]